MADSLEKSLDKATFSKVAKAAASGDDGAAHVVLDVGIDRDRRIEAPTAERAGKRDPGDRVGPIDPRDRPAFQLLVEPGGFAGRLEMNETRVNLGEKVRFDHRPESAVLAVIARLGRGRDNQAERGGAEREGQGLACPCHSTALPTPMTCGLQIHPIAA